MLAMPITYLPILSKTTKLTKNVHKNKQNTLNYIFNLSLKNHKNKKLIGVVFVILLICYNLWSNTIADWRSFSNLLSHIELKMLKYFNKKIQMLLRGKISLPQGYSVQRISKKAFEADSMSMSQCPKNG